jgi:cation:H+ antiporter
MDLFVVILFIVGIFLLIFGAELLVRGASSLAISIGISPLVVGLTVVAFSTSSPELAVIIQAGLMEQSDIAVGNVVGSNICNILLVLGLSAVVTPMIVSPQLTRFDVPVMIGVSVLLYLLGMDNLVSRFDGALLFAGIIAYTAWSIHKSRAETKEQNEHESQAHVPSDNLPESIGPLRWLIDLGLIAVGLGMLVLGARWLINGAVAFALLLGVSELIIGLTIVAVGTSLPEIATSVVAGLRGQRELVVGNVVGSNIFNILLIIGLGSLVTPIQVSETALQSDIPIMIAVALICLPVFYSNHIVTRWEGGLFLGYYTAYTIYLILSSTQSPLLPLFTQVVLMGVIPVTVVIILALAVRSAIGKRTRTA